MLVLQGPHDAGVKSAFLVEHQDGSREIKISGCVIDIVKIFSPAAYPGTQATLNGLGSSRIDEAEPTRGTEVLKNYAPV